MKNSIFATSLLVVFLSILSSGSLSAQEVWSLPSYAFNSVSQNPDEQIRGRIIARSDNGFQMTVLDERGFQDNVQLHQGTIINPTGLPLVPGMVVLISGFNAGNFFAANQIDTPYQSYGSYYGYQGHPWQYFGVGVALGFFFSNPIWQNHGYRGYRGYAYCDPRANYNGNPAYSIPNVCNFVP